MLLNKKERLVQEMTVQSSSIVGTGTTLKGGIESPGNFRIEGKVIGDIKAESKLVLGTSSQIDGNVAAKNAEVEGRIDGTIRVSGLLTLKPNAFINGNIFASKLVVEPGAKIEGKVNIGERQMQNGPGNGLKEEGKGGKEKILISA